MHGELGDQPGDMLWGEKFAAGFARVGGVVGDEKFVGIAEQVNLAGIIFFIKIMAEIQFRHAFEHGGEAEIFILHHVTQAVAGCVEIGKQPFDVIFRWIAVGGAFNGSKDGGQIGVQAFAGTCRSQCSGSIDRDLANQLRRSGVDVARCQSCISQSCCRAIDQTSLSGTAPLVILTSSAGCLSTYAHGPD